MAVPSMRDGDRDEGWRAAMFDMPLPGGAELKLYEKYKGINYCDRCGKLLEHGQWLCGLCKACEKKANEREARIVKPRKGLL